MNISEPFIRRPVMTTLVMASLLLFGLLAYSALPVSDLPSVDFPTIQVSANLPGASPETMASSVATPLEREFTRIPGVDSMSSSSALGRASITLQFDLDRDIDAAAQDVQTALSRATRQLPSEMPTPPTYSKVNPADQPIILLALSSKTLPLSTLDEFGQTMMAQRISMISGVAQVSVYGSQKYAVRIQVDPPRLQATGIGIDEVAQAVSNANTNLPAGTLYAPDRAYTLDATGQLFTADAYRDLVVAYRDGAPVRLQQLGKVFDSVENNKTAAWFATNDLMHRGVILAVQRQPGSNTIEITNKVRQLLPAFRAELPAAADLQVLFDRSEPIHESVQEVKFTLVLTVVLVVIVIFVFLRNVRATVIPSLAVPFSIVGTFAIMYLCDFSLNNLSLMALTLSVGFVVDDAIVMLENIVRRQEQGDDPLEAALVGSREVGFTIISMTISLAAVFLPILFMGGIIGRLFNEFGMTIATAVLFSGFVSLTLTPMLCRYFLGTKRHDSEHGKWYLWSERIFQRWVEFYGRTLQWAFRRQGLILGLSAALLLLTVHLFRTIPKGFLPSPDIGQVFGFAEAVQGISFDELKRQQVELTEFLRKNPHVQGMFSSAGARGGSSAANAGTVFMTLMPHDERDVTVDEFIEELRPQLSRFVGLQVFLQSPPAIRLGGNLTKSLYQFTMQSPNTDDLYRLGPVMEGKLAASPLLRDVTSDLQIKNPQVTVDIKRDRAAALGISPRQIEEALYYAYGSRQISTIYSPNNQYQVILEVTPEYQESPAALSALFVRGTNGTLIPLDTVAELRSTVGPLTVNHQGQLPSVTISFNLRPGVSLSQATNYIAEVARETLPATITTGYQGTAQAFQSSLQGIGVLLLMAVLVIYIVLGILYESFIHPVTILTALPFAGLGALLTLMAFGIELNLYGFVGIIMLIGLVKKNGIMMIDFALERERDGKSPEEAMYEACLVRFRPIMMTTLAALFGTVPLALAIGAGAEARQPLGVAVIGGLLFSQTLTLYVTPVFYVAVERAKARLSRKTAGHEFQALSSLNP